MSKTNWISTLRMWSQNMFSGLDNHDKRISDLEKRIENLENMK